MVERITALIKSDLRSRKTVTAFCLMGFFALAYASEEALSDEFLDYLTDYADPQGDVLDPVDLVVLQSKQAETEQNAEQKKSAQEQDQ